MRSLVSLFGALLVALLLLPQSALAWGELRVASTDVNVRAARRVDAPKVVVLKKGQRVKVDFIQGKWAAIFPLDAADQDEAMAIGYASIKLLQYVGAAPEVSPQDELVVEVKPEPAVSNEPAEAQVVHQEENAVVAKVQEHMDDVEQSQAQGDKGPVKITSDRMVYNEAKRTVIFEGTVRADHQDLVLHSETLTAYFAKDAGKKKGEDQIDRIVASGGVQVNRGTTEGRCSTLIYMVQTGVLRMEGNPVLEDGDNTITGAVILFYMKDNRSEVVGGKNKRVQAVFSAPGDIEP